MTKVAGSLADQMAAHLPRMRQWANKFTRDWAAAQDLAQDAMVKALANQDKFTDESNLAGWLYTIVHHLYVTQLMKSRRFQKVEELEDGLYERHGQLGVSSNAGEESFGLRLLESALSSLDERDRTIMVLRVQGYRYDEIADAVAVPIGTVKNRIFQARHQLTDYIMNPTVDVLEAPAPTGLPQADASEKDAFAKALIYLCAMVPHDAFVAIDKEGLIRFSAIPKSYVTSLLAELAEQKALTRQPNGPGFLYKRLPLLNSISAVVVRKATMKRLMGQSVKVEFHTPEPVALPPKPEIETPPVETKAPPTSVAVPIARYESTRSFRVRDVHGKELGSHAIVFDNSNPPKCKALPVETPEPISEKPAPTIQYGFLSAEGPVWCGSKDVLLKQATAAVEAGEREVILIQRIGVVVSKPVVQFD